MKRLFLLYIAFGAIIARGQTLMPIPDTLSGTIFNLDVHQDSVQFFPGKKTQTLGVNGNHYLGPTLLLRRGDHVTMNVHNQIGDTTTMHWHGLHVAPKNDGGPSSMIMDGDTWSPDFTVMNRAATYWYHPHMMAKTAAQAIKGDAGLIIVRDDDEAALVLPRKYGVDDFPIIVQSAELDTNNQFMPKGMEDSTVLVNGTDTPYVNMPAQVVRLRILNAAGERSFNFGLTANKPFSIVGNDAGLLTTPVTQTRIRLSPGERAEILVNLTGMTGQTIFLKSYASELPMGVQGGPTMPMPPGSPPMNSPLNGVDFNILQINVTAPTASPVTTIPATLVADTPLTESMSMKDRYITMTADSLMVMDGPFYFNHNLFDMMRIDYKVPLNNIEVWTLFDSTMVAHPFHLHDVHFYILDRNGVAPPPEERGRKDVLLIQSMERVRFIAQFTDFADTTTPYMYHCHILMHEDDGMMGQFVVTTEPDKVTNNYKSDEFVLYPNPAGKSVTIKVNTPSAGHGYELRIMDALGRLMVKDIVDGQATIATNSWPHGMYVVSLTKEGQKTYKQLIVGQ